MTQVVNNIIDSIVVAKKSVVNTLVSNEELRKPLNTFIDAQATFGKKVAAEVNEFVTTVGLATFSADMKKVFGTK